MLRRRGRSLLPLGALAILGAGKPPPAAAELEVSISGLRNQQGAVMLCLTRRSEQLYLECDKDPDRITRQAAAAGPVSFRIGALAPGDYSLLVIHDENRNGRLDKTLGMPREGFGFSRNPALRIGPPRYADVRFALPAQGGQAVKLRYLL